MSFFTVNNDVNQQDVFFSTLVLLAFVAIWVSSLVSPILCVIFTALGAFEVALLLAAIIIVAYAPWPKSEKGRVAVSRAFIQYFKRSSVMYEESLPANPKNLVCVHPHGIFCMGWSILFGRSELDNYLFCFSAALYKSPFFRLLAKTVGNPESADKASFTQLMREGKSLALIPGGFEEATITCDGADRVFLKDRRGFVKYALTYGYSLTPVYCFGENKTYSNIQGAWRLRFWLNSLGFPAIVPFGKWWCPLLPKSGRMHVVVGKALVLPTIESPTKDQVAEHHGRYIAALTDLYDRNKKLFGEAEGVLEVW